MELSEKLKELRRKKGITQDKLASVLFVSRTAVSKWESGNGYPSIDSLKLISQFYEITIDELLSNDELLSIAKMENISKTREYVNFFLGLIDISLLILFFIPIFGVMNGDIISNVSLISLKQVKLYVIIPYYAITIMSIIWGTVVVFTSHITSKKWQMIKCIISLSMSFIMTSLFLMTQQPYTGFLCLVYLLIKTIIIIKSLMTR